MHLFEDRNFAGALVEFEASYQQNPTAVALQNIAVCQKGLFRYAEAISTLERMLQAFKAQLSPEDKKAAEEAIRDMNALLGTVVLKITPPDARVSVNDSTLSPEALKSPVRLAAGEYRVVAEAPGYARQERMLRVVSGQVDLPLTIALTPLSGTLAIHAHDSQAAIAIDGAPGRLRRMEGPSLRRFPRDLRLYADAKAQEQRGRLRWPDHRARRQAHARRCYCGGRHRPGGAERSAAPMCRRPNEEFTRSRCSGSIRWPAPIRTASSRSASGARAALAA